MRLRGERIERTFAHTLDTGGMRRTHLRGHENILKRVLIHVAGFNLGLVMRARFGYGKPRCLQGRLAAFVTVLIAFFRALIASRAVHTRPIRISSEIPVAQPRLLVRFSVA